MDKATILKSYKQHLGDQYAVARDLGITALQVYETIRQMEHTPEDGVRFVVCVKPRPENLGRPEIRKNIISVRHRDEAGWPVEDRDAIELNRTLCDEGYVDLAQGFDGGWVIQYAFKRRRREKNRRVWLTVPRTYS